MLMVVIQTQNPSLLLHAHRVIENLTVILPAHSTIMRSAETYIGTRPDAIEGVANLLQIFILTGGLDIADQHLVTPVPNATHTGPVTYQVFSTTNHHMMDVC
jgi:hypothetical protein